jgi:rubrerythrin
MADLIDRGALLAKKWDWCDAEDAIRSMPTVDAAPVVHARWDPITRIFKYSKQWTCSVCGIPSLTNRHKFCPGCGARMDAKED